MPNHTANNFTIKMNKNTNLVLRNLIIDLLDNENGVDEKQFDSIVKLCEYFGFQDILDKVDTEWGGIWLWEADAADLRQIVK